MTNHSGPRVFHVTLNPSGEAVVELPLAWAETLKEKLRSYDLVGEMSVSPTSSSKEAIATLNFGFGADVPQIQKIIDSFTIPPLPIVMG